MLNLYLELMYICCSRMSYMFVGNMDMRSSVVRLFLFFFPMRVASVSFVFP